MQSKTNLIEDFKQLLQIQSLQRHIVEAEGKIKEEEKRLEVLDKQIQYRANELEENNSLLTSTKEELRESEKNYHKVSEQLELAKERLPSLTKEAQVKATETEIENLGQKKDLLEEETLSAMEKIEELSAQVEEGESFASGVVKTREEILGEIDKCRQEQEKNISSLKNRIKDIIQLLPDLVKRKFELINQKHEFKKPISYIDSNSCQECKVGLEKNLIHLVEQGTTVEICPGCQRILSPLTALT